MKGLNHSREKLKNGLLIAVCIILAGAVFGYTIIGGAGRPGSGDAGDGPDEPGQQEFVLHEEKEGISQAEACRLLSYLHCGGAEQKKLALSDELAAAVGEAQGKEHFAAVVDAGYLPAERIAPDVLLTCGDFRDILVAVCQEEELDYYRVTDALPQRLKTVKEEDRLYLGEFLTLYEVLCRELADRDEEKRPDLPAVRPVFVLALGDGTTFYDEYGKRFSYGGCEDYSEALAEAAQLPPVEDEFSRQAAGRKGGKPKEMSDYENFSVGVLASGQDILYIRGEVWQQVTLPNVWVTGASGSRVSAYVSGFYREYETWLPLQGGLENQVCDIDIYDGTVRGLTVKGDVIQGKVLLTSEEMIEIEGYGQLPLEENFRIYKIYGELAMEKTNRILVGYTITDFVVSDGQICAALIKEKLKADNIRVLINTTGYKSRYHDEVRLTADREFTVRRGEELKTYRAGEQVSFTAAEERSKNERAVVETVGGEGKITLLSVGRTCGNPAYRGTIEVAATADGLLVVNELSMEEYLYAVIPSEMPTSYGSEALKVQAVCARSYAFNQLVASRFRSCGAHVDDSVSCQVYNNVAENEASILAVKETYGLVAAFKGSVITAYYFSTSCGHTASYEEVWESASAVAYLTGCMQNGEKEQRDLSEESDFRDFILSKEEKTFDQRFSWYRWEVNFPAEQLAEQLCAATGLKSVESVQVTKRGVSGIALELTVTGTKKAGGQQEACVISYQTAIRTALAPKKTSVVRMDGGETANMSLLPSAFFVIEETRQDGKLTGWKVNGGGYGHGAGMSQNGVKAMVDEGYGFEEIVGHYYTGAELIFLY
ncbi:MAG: SpoIID/LytB domain-containing protein [Lachnospiraceae bacterium]|nr:SpoIID/LytB domain-containing protein [Lachnospiraceae bacterium]